MTVYSHLQKRDERNEDDRRFTAVVFDVVVDLVRDVRVNEHLPSIRRPNALLTAHVIFFYRCLDKNKTRRLRQLSVYSVLSSRQVICKKYLRTAFNLQQACIPCKRAPINLVVTGDCDVDSSYLRIDICLMAAQCTLFYVTRPVLRDARCFT